MEIQDMDQELENARSRIETLELAIEMALTDLNVARGTIHGEDARQRSISDAIRVLQLAQP